MLVVGAGNSGCDIAVDVAQHRFDVDIVIREGLQFQPKTLLRRPARSRSASWPSSRPDEQDLIARLLARVVHRRVAELPGHARAAGADARRGAGSSSTSCCSTGSSTAASAWCRASSRWMARRSASSTAQPASTTRSCGRPGFHASLPFLDPSLVQRRNGVPLRYAAGVVPAGLEKLYYIGLAAPRGPQIPVYGVQAKLAIRMVALHEAAGEGGAGVDVVSGRAPGARRSHRHRPGHLERAAGRHRAAARCVRRRTLPAAGRLVRLVRLSRGQRRHVAHVTEDEPHLARPRRDVARLTDEASLVPSLRHLLAHALQPRTPEPHMRRDVAHATEDQALVPRVRHLAAGRAEKPDVLRLMRHIPAQLRCGMQPASFADHLRRVRGSFRRPACADGTCEVARVVFAILPFERVGCATRPYWRPVIVPRPG